MKKERIRHKDLTFDAQPTGWLVISALVNGYFMTRKYGGYTKKQAARLFLEEANGKEQMT